jgi:hypothetical protein
MSPGLIHALTHASGDDTRRQRAIKRYRTSRRSNSPE